MMNQETIDRIKAAVDRLTTLAEQYSWQSAAITGKDTEGVGLALMQMAINELLRAQLIEVALMQLGYRADSTDPPKERIPIGRDAEEMLELDKKAVTESIVLCEDVLGHHPEDDNTGCPVRELFEELCREEEKQLNLLEALLNRCGKCANKSEKSSPPESWDM